MHYVDEGSGEPVVFVHGNPAWSFEFRHLIEGLRSEFRCVAPDHLGFGLSSRSDSKDDHHPAAHAEAFAALLHDLDLRDVTLFLTDWGGPIGLDFARRNPDRVKRLIVTNTWCWPVNRDPHFWFFSRMMASPLGQYLIKRRNFFVNGVMPRAVGNKEVLVSEVMEHYRNAQPSAGGARRQRRPAGPHRRRDGLAPRGLARPLGLLHQTGAHLLGLQGHCLPHEGT